MNNINNKFKNLKKLLKNEYIIVALNLNNIKKSLINLIFKKINFRIVFLKKKDVLLFKFKNFNCLHLFIIKNNEQFLKNILLLIFNIFNKKPVLLLYKNCIIKNIPIEEFSNLSNKNLILKIVKFLKSKFQKLIKLLKKHEKHISR